MVMKCWLRICLRCCVDKFCRLWMCDYKSVWRWMHCEGLVNWVVNLWNWITQVLNLQMDLVDGNVRRNFDFQFGNIKIAFSPPLFLWILTGFYRQGLVKLLWKSVGKFEWIARDMMQTVWEFCDPSERLLSILDHWLNVMEGWNWFEWSGLCLRNLVTKTWLPFAGIFETWTRSSHESWKWSNLKKYLLIGPKDPDSR